MSLDFDTFGDKLGNIVKPSNNTKSFWDTMKRHHYYLAQDRNGLWHSFQFKPKLGKQVWEPIDGVKERVGNSKIHEGGWKKTLRMRPDSHLIVWFKDVAFVVVPEPIFRVWFQQGCDAYFDKSFSFIERDVQYKFQSWTNFHLFNIETCQITDNEATQLLQRRDNRNNAFFNFQCYEE